jgi:hypothetical protein
VSALVSLLFFAVVVGVLWAALLVDDIHADREHGGTDVR